MNHSPWDYLRKGETKSGLATLREAYPRDASASQITELGTAYLWSHHYDEAWEHFQHAMLTYRFTTAGFFGRAGVAKWCLGESQMAVEWWEQGMGSQYVDAAGGIRLPLLLYVASILQPNAFPRKEAIRLLKAETNNPRTQNWPGPLGLFVLGEIDNKQLIELAAKRKGGVVPRDRTWLIDFYRSFREVDSGYLNHVEFRKLARELVDLSKPHWTDERDFLHLIWNDEFFIARHQAITA